MTWADFSNLADEGLSKILSLVVIYAVIKAIQKGPAYFRRLIVATENSTAAITLNSQLIKFTEEMHEEMDMKIDDLKQDVEHIKTELKKFGVKDDEIIRAIHSLELKIDKLGKSREVEGSD